MSYIRRHVCGPHTVASIVGQGLWVNGQPRNILDAISPRISASGRVAYKTHETGAAMVLELDGSVWGASSVTAGHAPLAWAGEDLLVQRDNSGVLLRVRPDGSATTHPIGRYASEGIAKVLDDGTVILSNERTFRTDVNPLVKLWNWDEDAHGNIVGLSEAGHPSFGCVALWKASESCWLMWVPPTHIQEAPAISDGRVAISGLDTPEPDAVPWVPLAFPAPVVVVPARPSLPPVPPTMPAFWIGCATDASKGQPKGPGNCAWGAQPHDDRPVTESAVWASTITGRQLLCGLWLSDNNADPATVDAEIAFTKAQGGYAVYLHEDDATQRANVLAASARVLAAGLEPIKASHVNHGELMVWRDGVTLNVRTHSKDLFRLRDGIVGAIETIRTALFPPRVVLIYGWYDGGPLEDRYPELAAYLSAVIAKVGTPDLRPGETRSPVVILKPPVVVRPPTPPRPARRRRWWEFWK